eukprot:s1725_g6.t1
MPVDIAPDSQIIGARRHLGPILGWPTTCRARMSAAKYGAPNGPEPGSPQSPGSPASPGGPPREKSFGALSQGVASVGARSEGVISTSAQSVKSALSGTSPNGSRKDRKGNAIKKGQTSSHKLTFADQLGNKESLTEGFLSWSGSSELRYPGALLTPSGEIDLNAAVGRRHLVEEFGLKPRDIAAMFSKNARRGFGLNVRRGGALLSLGRDGPSVVVANTTAWILLRDSRDKSLADVGAKIQQKFVDLAASVREQHTAEEPGHTAEEPRHIAEEPGREPVPFALAVTEAALLTIYLDKISGELEEAVEKADLLIRDYTAMRQDQAGTPQLEKLRITKQRLDAVQSQAKSFQTVLLQALEDEDDGEWELCFEYYSQSAAEVDAEVSAHVEAMDDLENFWLLRLSARRLELEKSQLWLEVLGVGLNVGAVITGIFVFKNADDLTWEAERVQLHHLLVKRPAVMASAKKLQLPYSKGSRKGWQSHTDGFNSRP